MGESSFLDVAVWISASSPLLDYSPNRNGEPGQAWFQEEQGVSKCSGSGTFAVQLDSIYFSNLLFVWSSSSSSYKVQVGLDGSLNSGSATSGAASLQADFGHHSARLECSCETCSSSSSDKESFELVGVKLETQVVASGAGVNSTLDDASSKITYSGFQSTSNIQSSVPAIKKGSFYKDTISYTSSAGAAASLIFNGSALYVFGMTGPEFGSFQISIDSSTIGTYNASTTVETYNTLLFFTTHLDPSSQHEIQIKNQNDGKLFALDYIVAVQPTRDGKGESSQTASASGPKASADFGKGDGNGYSGKHGGDSAGAVIGGILGGLAGLFVLWVWWRYYQWKKAGGKGSFFVAMCGGERQKVVPAKKAEEKKFHLWPMIWSRPKYAVEGS
ncbi:hypothetical protein IAR55_006073 [Kwoniella newhampshirensis]|uniref:Uncharacterized protein n=1 Tax=Kwoniella newhampshirensis TaxID=1651941 RepID=A0AAW0YUM7_9TREE